MDFLKDNILKFLILPLFFISGCFNPQIERIEIITGLDLSEYLTKQDERNQWNDFNGDGYKVILYKIDNYIIEELVASARNKKFKYYDEDDYESSSFLSNSKFTTLLNNSKGFYKTIWGNNEIETVIIDTTDNKLIYSFTVL